MARISVDELHSLLQQGQRPTIVDVRSPLLQQGVRIPGAISMSEDVSGIFVSELPADGEVILYCACPNDAPAARAAKQLMQPGYRRVRPLQGGIDAWIEAGYTLETGAAATN